MNDSIIPTNQLKPLCLQFAFGETHVEELLPKGLVKYGLNKLRWVLTDFGISHYFLPEMPIADYIMMAACLDEQIVAGNNLSETVFYRILSTRNILKLLCRAYDYSNSVKNYYDLPISVVIDVIGDNHLLDCNDADVLLHDFSLSPLDSIKIVADELLSHVEQIVDLCDSKSLAIQRLIAGTDEEQLILSAYELYHLLFPVFFSLQLPSDYSAEALNDKYHTTRFQDGYNDEFTKIVHTWKERSITQ
ncbi:MAG: hypothetical protein IJ526_08290 [Lachnospiraceae bacterium]|nr:hypothetical protein [Lachnospiraceae bacterium]